MLVARERKPAKTQQHMLLPKEEPVSVQEQVSFTQTPSGALVGEYSPASLKIRDLIACTQQPHWVQLSESQYMRLESVAGRLEVLPLVNNTCPAPCRWRVFR